MQVARNLLSRGHGDAAQNLDRAIKLAADGIAEGLAAIHGLRCQAADQGDLEEMLSVAGQELAACRQGERPVRFRVIVEGRRQQLKARPGGGVPNSSRAVAECFPARTGKSGGS
jgi:hypothetical protein